MANVDPVEACVDSVLQRDDVGEERSQSRPDVIPEQAGIYASISGLDAGA